MSLYQENLQKRFNSLDSRFYASQEEIKAFADAVGVDSNMVEIDQKCGNLHVKLPEKPGQEPQKASA